MNKAILLGTIGTVPEKRTTQSNKTIVTFSMATNKVWYANNKKNTSTEWHNIICWNISDALFECLSKGTNVLVEGEIQHQQYEKNGEKKSHHQIVCNSLHLAGGKRNDSKESSSNLNVNDAYNDVDNLDDIPF